jgi:hypothetical protein
LNKQRDGLEVAASRTLCILVDDDFAASLRATERTGKQQN